MRFPRKSLRFFAVGILLIWSVWILLFWVANGVKEWQQKQEAWLVSRAILFGHVAPFKLWIVSLGYLCFIFHVYMQKYGICGGTMNWCSILECTCFFSRNLYIVYIDIHIHTYIYINIHIYTYHSIINVCVCPEMVVARNHFYLEHLFYSI